MLVSIEATVGHAQHAGPNAWQQFGAKLPLPVAVRADVGAQDGVRGALDQDDVARLRIAGMAGHAGATAGIVENRSFVGFVRQLEAAAVNGGHRPTAGSSIAAPVRAAAQRRCGCAVC